MELDKAYKVLIAASGRISSDWIVVMVLLLKIMRMDIMKMMLTKNVEEEKGGLHMKPHVKDFINVLATNFGENMLISLAQKRLPDNYGGSIP